MKIALVALAAFLMATPAFAVDSWDSEPADSATTNATDGMAQARAAIGAQQWEKALQILDEALDDNPINPDGYNLLGYAARKLGQYDLSLDSYQKALKLDPKHKAALEYLGELYLQTEKPDLALAQLKRLEQLCPQGCAERTQLAAALEKAGVTLTN